MKKFLMIFFIFLLIGLSLGGDPTGGTGIVKDVEFDSANQRISILTSGPLKYHCFRVTKPERLVIEITNAVLELQREISQDGSQRIIEIGDLFVKRIRIAQHKKEPVKIVRIVMDLEESVNYVATQAGGEIKLDISPIASVEKEKEKPKKVVKSATPSRKKKKMERNIPTEEHKKAVGEIRKKRKKRKVKKIKEKPPKAKVKAKIKKEEIFPEISREIISSFNFYEADVREILRTLSLKSGMNIICDPDVKGAITLNLKNVPFDDVFRMVLKLSGLAARRESPKIIRVISPEKLKAERQKAATFTRVFPLNYATAKDIQTQLKGVELAGVKGNIAIDTWSNSLLITSTPGALEEYARLIEKLDARPKQVMIEARIMEVKITDDFDMGINWSFAKGAQTPGKIVIGRTGNFGYDGTPENVLGAGSGGTGVNIPAQPTLLGEIGAVTIGYVMDDGFLNATLSMLKQQGKTRMLSNPRITALNNEEANIKIIDKFPYTEYTVSEGVYEYKTSWLEVGIDLTVTPTISLDERIILKIRPEISSVTEWTAGGLPVITTREADARVIVENNQTIVLGGLIKETAIETIMKIPILGDIPLINLLFRRKLVDNERTELLIFLTPRIIVD